MRTPQTRHLCSPYSRATVQTRPRPWRQSQPPRAEDWQAKYLAWMNRGELPPDRSEARRIARMDKSFTVIDGDLYKCAASGVLQRCIPIPQGRELIRDIHAGVCVHHAAPRTLVGNAFRQGFTSPPRSLMPTRSYVPTRGASSMPAGLISRLTPFKRFPSHGLSPCGGWTSSGPCERRPGATLTCWSPWISSLSGSRRAQSRTSGQSRPCHSSPTSSTDLGYRMPSSLTTGPIYRQEVPGVLREIPHPHGLGGHCTPTDQWSGGACQWHDPTRS
jgi:hypothetical protein